MATWAAGRSKGKRRTDGQADGQTLPVCLRRPQQSDAAVSVQFDLTLCPFDGALEAFAEEPLKDVEKNKIRRTRNLKVTLSDLDSFSLELF